ncbi:MAG: ATP-binding protein [Pseudomonadota bacterium]
MSEPPPSSAPRIISTTAGAFVLLGGVVSFVGWAAGAPRLTDWAGVGIAIKANTALAASAAGLALMLAVWYPAGCIVIRVLAAFAGLLGGLTLFEHLSGWSLGIDTLLFDEPPGAAATVAPGRMGPPAAFGLLAIGVALLLKTLGPRSRGASVVLALLTLTIGVLSLVGYWYGAEAMYTLPRLTGVAPQTASMLAALGIGLVAAHPDRQPMRMLCEDSTAGIQARRLMPLVLLLPLLLGWLGVRGHQLELYDTAFGTALRSVIEAAILSGVLWWSLCVLRVRDALKDRAESQLRDSEHQLAQTLESIADGFVTFDKEWRFTFANKEAERLLGHPHRQLLGESLWTLFPAAVGGTLYQEFHRAANGRLTLEVEGVDLAGPGRHFSHRLYPSADGSMSVYFQDTTRRRQAEDALREADRRKDEFLATLAHELRNPLAPIRNAAKILLKPELPPTTLQWGAGVISRQVHHMARLLEDLLDVSRVSRNLLEIRQEWIELAAILASAQETSRPVIEAAGHTLRVELPPEPIYLNGDPVRLAQVFANLLNNAAKYTEPGGLIHVTARCERGEVQVQVHDNGIGIAAEMLPRVFEMFTQAKPALTRAQGGLGIGLSLARSVVELHGGRIEVHSAGVGQGSTFAVYLPTASLATHRAAATVAGSVRQLSSRRLLVADDLKDNADSLAAILRMEGHEVQVAYSGEDALTAARTFLPHAMFLDLGMPLLSGFDVCRQIRQSPWGKDMRIVAVTGWGQPEDRRRTKEAGFDHHLIKPADAETVLALVASFPQEAAHS